MTPVEIRDDRSALLEEYKALKAIFGELLLEQEGAASPEDVAYYQRKFREAQQRLKR